MLGLAYEVRHQQLSNPMTISLKKAVQTLFERRHDIDKMEAIEKRMDRIGATAVATTLRGRRRLASIFQAA